MSNSPPTLNELKGNVTSCVALRCVAMRPPKLRVPIRGSTLPYGERVRVVRRDEPFRWLAAGWRDVRVAMGVSVAYGMIVVVAGFILSFLLAGAGLLYLVLPLIVGFMLVGPALTVGYY